MKKRTIVLASMCLFATAAAAQQPGGRGGGAQLTPEQQAQRASERARQMAEPRPIDARNSSAPAVDRATPAR